MLQKIEMLQNKKVTNNKNKIKKTENEKNFFKNS
jgi:hypothetical protein